MKKLLCMVLLLSMITGCAAMPTAGEVQIVKNPAIDKPSDQGTVYFFRESAFTGSGISYYIYDGQARIGAAWSGCYFAATISPGLHTFWGETEDKKYVTINVEPGKTYYVAMGVGMGFWAGVPELNQVVPEVALPIIHKLDYCKLVPKPPEPPRTMYGNQN